MGRTRTHRFEARDVSVDVVVDDVVALDTSEQLPLLREQRRVALDRAHVRVEQVLLLFHQLLHCGVEVEAELAISRRRHGPRAASCGWRAFVLRVAGAKGGGRGEGKGGREGRSVI